MATYHQKHTSNIDDQYTLSYYTTGQHEIFIIKPLYSKINHYFRNIHYNTPLLFSSSMKITANITCIDRHRIATDGNGITTLVVFHGCPLRCHYCINPQTIIDTRQYRTHTPQSLYNLIKIDELYFKATNGGVAFGGGEPALHPHFISQFRETCGPSWGITIETSLNVPSDNIATLIPIADQWIIDIKDMNPDIYMRYTGKSNSHVINNLHILSKAAKQSNCTIRLPLIAGFNSISDRYKSRNAISMLGYTNFDMFTYKTTPSNHDTWQTQM